MESGPRCRSVAHMRDELRRFLQRRGDDALAAALTALVLLEVALTDGPELGRVATVAAAIALGAAASMRRRVPLLLLGLVLVISLASTLRPITTGHTESIALFVLLAVYSAAAHTSGRATFLAAAMTVGVFLTDLGADPQGIYVEGIVFYALLFGLPWVAGRAIQQRRVKDTQLEHEKGRAAAAIVEERERIARELHDVVAHSISVMVLQARGGRRVLQSEPADARDAFATIERTGTQALDEMRRLLGILRTTDEALALAPQPSLRQLGRLVEQVRAAGLPVELAVEGEPRELPPGVDLSAYRIVQEALTNALKHAGPARARVVLRYGADDLELEIADDGARSSDASGSSSGYGLIGMRERVSVYGGELRAGREPGGGYALRVRLPLRSARA
jgi:signal transduction histidine kinase